MDDDHENRKVGYEKTKINRKIKKFFYFVY